jgi:hypothetical protein
LSELPGNTYDWIFNYELSRPVFCKESIDDDTIKFVKGGNNLKGFDIIVNNETDSKAREVSCRKVKNLERILIILSGMELEARLTGDERLPKKPELRRISKTFTIKYDIEGSIDKIDITDPHIEKLINQDINPELEYLSKAVAHKNHGRYSESIKEGFRIIDEEKSVKHYSTFVTDYDKYRCIRNILSHKEGDPLRRGTMDDFIHYFGSNAYGAFDFKQYEPSKNIIIFDSECASTKTQKTLEQLSRDLVSEIRNILKL